MIRHKSFDGKPACRSASEFSVDRVVVSSRRPRFRIFIADKHEIVRAGLRTIVAGEPDLDVAGEAGSAETMLADARRIQPDVIVFGGWSVGTSDIDLCKGLFHALPSIRILLIGSGHGVSSFRQALESGAQGFLMDNAGREEIVRAIRTVAQGTFYLGPEAVGETFRLLRASQAKNGLRAGLEVFSVQERHILGLMADGNTNKEIAGKMVLSDKTVKNYIANIFAKLEIHHRTQAVAYYLKTQLRHASTGELIAT
jgi:two-component system, NarL family, response regulator DevR